LVDVGKDSIGSAERHHGCLTEENGLFAECVICPAQGQQEQQGPPPHDQPNDEDPERSPPASDRPANLWGIAQNGLLVFASFTLPRSGEHLGRDSRSRKAEARRRQHDEWEGDFEEEDRGERPCGDADQDRILERLGADPDHRCGHQCDDSCLQAVKHGCDPGDVAVDGISP
jgi:hypothetical protein